MGRADGLGTGSLSLNEAVPSPLGNACQQLWADVAALLQKLQEMPR
jgi:hypothetical protein